MTECLFSLEFTRRCHLSGGETLISPRTHRWMFPPAYLPVQSGTAGISGRACAGASRRASAEHILIPALNRNLLTFWLHHFLGGVGCCQLTEVMVLMAEVSEEDDDDGGSAAVVL